MSSSTKFDPSKDIFDLSGRVAIVTGGNTGIGYSTVKFLARRGAKVYLSARNESTATDAIARLEKEGLGSGQVVFLKLDLIDPRLAKKSAEDYIGKEKRLDILVNNAGLLTDLRQKTLQTPDGMSVMMATNYIGPYVFTRSLLDLLVKTAQEPDSDVRIVNVSSHMHRMTAPATDFDDPVIFHDECKKYTTPSFGRYAVSKYAMNLWTTELQRRLDAEGRNILVMALHPGAVNTYARFFPLSRLFNLLFSAFLDSPDEGASTSLFAAASPLVRADPDKYRGQYLMPVGTLTSSASTRDAEMAVRLWSNTESFLQSLGV
ncbi:NAD(P)-binding protein [Mycena rosella]|uniref:NAD(P)-binding protein n=1 Tax=Mycena rosella TaxID=1033263 RepID=A0AAD7FCS0_MYCRO|nr:NAD(P)-binding protein [Mycena rosella]